MASSVFRLCVSSSPDPLKGEPRAGRTDRVPFANSRENCCPPGTLVNVPLTLDSDCDPNAADPVQRPLISRSFLTTLSRGSLAKQGDSNYTPPMIAAADIEQMTLTERIKAMELLWRSITAAPASVVSPAWHGEVLQQRRAKLESGKAEFLTLAQLKKRLGKRRR